MSAPGAVGAGRYRLGRLLGSGGAADVYLAHDVELDRPVAVKVLAATGGDEHSARFAREARLAAGIAHPNVVRVFDAGEDGGTRYIVMEYVEGESLADVLRRRGKLPPAEALQLGLEAAAGLAAAHRAGLVHRDVKPANVLVAADGTPKIADFGIAWTADATRLTAHGTLLGTAAYVAPEQAEPGDLTPAADVYSLAAVLYETLTGRVPREVGSPAELAARPPADGIVPVRDREPSVSAAVEAVLMRALARDPRYRPADGAELAAALEAAAAEGTPAARPNAKSPSNTLFLVRRPRALLVAAAALAAAVAAVLALILPGRETRRPGPTVVRPVATAGDAEGQARNLARWIREYSR